MSTTSRRRFLGLVAGAGMAPYAFGSAEAAAPARNPSRSAAVIGDGVLYLEFDSRLRARISHVRGEKRVPLTPWSASESLSVAGQGRIEAFALEKVERENLEGPQGAGVRLLLTGTGSPDGDASTRIEKSLRIELYERYPGL
ncbi:MAG: hypothetical protein ACHP9U_06450, partial [Steroidobacterales bacterium]